MRLALAADRVFTARSDAAEAGVVVIDEWPASSASIARRRGRHAGAATARARRCCPGLIDAHTHVSIVPSRGNQIEQMKLPAVEQLATARSNVWADLLSGVTTMRIMGQELDVDFLLRDEIAAGRHAGPRAGVRRRADRQAGRPRSRADGGGERRRHRAAGRRQRRAGRRADQDFHDRRRVERRIVARRLSVHAARGAVRRRCRASSRAEARLARARRRGCAAGDGERRGYDRARRAVRRGADRAGASSAA